MKDARAKGTDEARRSDGRASDAEREELAALRAEVRTLREQVSDLRTGRDEWHAAYQELLRRALPAPAEPATRRPGLLARILGRR